MILLRIAANKAAHSFRSFQTIPITPAKLTQKSETLW